MANGEAKTLTANSERAPGEPAPHRAAFLRALVSLVRAEDGYGAWDSKPDAELLAPFTLTREERRAIPIIADPEPETLHRVEQYYRAVALAIEQQSGLMAVPMMHMSHEGFGRVVLMVGRLVVYSRTLRDVHRFGFDDVDTLGAEGSKTVGAALEILEQFPEVARA